MLLRLLPLALLLAPACRKADDRDVSVKARVTPKSGEVWGRDLATGLGLHAWELCEELGQYDCISDAHLITLGGVEPTTLGVDKPQENASVSAPIAVDRVAISACGERYARDLSDTPVLFGPVLEGNSARSRREVSEGLIRRLLSRHPTKEEVDGLVDLYETLEPLSDDPVKDWCVGACVVVATSTEALFY
ncbi:MAG: hypothetical protein H6741_32745 [Alphaproteobacteria bacterium]|nr:hypothetical protein [Alphaproteobacteria bacterium]MCB9797485.1 hypothetical protein [Alphaproteobacteria bacterium]